MKLNTIGEGLWKDLSALLNYNFNKLGIAVKKVGETGSSHNSAFKGVFRTEALLKQSFPTPIPGEYAFIPVVTSGGSETTTFIVWVANTDGVWVGTSGYYKPDYVPEDYIETIEVDDIKFDTYDDIKDYNNNNDVES